MTGSRVEGSKGGGPDMVGGSTSAMQKRGQAGSCFVTTCNAKKYSFDSGSDSGAVFIRSGVRKEPVVSSSASLNSSIASLEQATRRYFRISECKSTELALADDEMLHPKSVPSGTVQLLLTDLPSNIRPKKDAKHSSIAKSQSLT